MFAFLSERICSTLNKGIGMPHAAFVDMHHSRLFFMVSRKSEKDSHFPIFSVAVLSISDKNYPSSFGLILKKK
jgi:hypothetical protein